MKICDFHGYEVFYDDVKRKFEAYKNGEIVCEDETQNLLEEQLKKLCKFKKILTINVGYEHDAQIGEITSMHKERGFRERITIWFVWKNGENFLRTKGSLSSGRYYEATPENIEIAKQMQKLAQERDRLFEKARKLEEQLKNPITDKNIAKLAGIE